MKIGEFAKKYNVPISTIRYYIEEGLLTPRKKGAQYDFNEANESEIQLLIDLRESSFSLEEMRQFVNISRILDEKDPARYKELKALFRGKRARLTQQIQDIKGTIHTINLKLDDLEAKESILVPSHQSTPSPAVSHGLPLSFLTYIACPDCGRPLDMENAKLSAGTVLSGTLKCSCGYEGRIEDGIIYVDSHIDLDQDPVFCDDYFSDPFTSGDESLFYECFLSAPQGYLSINYEARTWINEIVQERLSPPGIILFPDIASVFPYLYSDSEYLQKAILVIMGLSKKATIATRKHMDTLDSDLNIIYIVSPSNRLPLRKKTIDLLVDYLSSYNYAFFFDRPFYDYIDSYFSDTASIAGFLSYYKPGSESVRNITDEYSHAMNPFIDLSSYMENLRSHGYTITADKAIGSNTVLSDYFHYHVHGEQQYLHTFLASRQPSDLPDDEV